MAKLIICPTPLGNLGDMPPRAVEALRAADLVCAEDTRVTGKLLAALGVEKRLERLDEAMISGRGSAVVDRVAAGETIAYCSDAGMPGVSDPGLRLVDMALDAGVEVEVIPGPTAVTTAYVCSGFSCPQFYFGGFFPRKVGERRAVLEKFADLDAVLLFYESPNRIVDVLQVVAEVLPQRRVAVCRELTKLHEEVLRGTAAEVREALAAREGGVRGEIVLVLDAPNDEERAVVAESADQQADVLAERMAAEGASQKDIVKALRKDCGLSRNAAYDKALAALRTCCAVILCCVLCLSAAVFTPSAFAVTNSIDDEPDAYQAAIEEASVRYDEAAAKAEELQKSIDANKERLNEINTVLPEQKARCEKALGALYKMRREGGNLLNMLLGVTSWDEFINTMEYVGFVQDRQTQEIARYTALKKEAEEKGAQMDAELAEVEKVKIEAAQALAEAQAARDRAREEARARQAAEAAAAAAADEAARQAAEQDAQNAEGGSDTPGSSGGAIVPPPASDGADWGSDKSSFVAQWAPRIDAYLAGSPMAGTGSIFAAAAWDYNVDPRWSPAIAFLESSRGMYCFRPYNAWGWGNVSWDSWEEAIPSHVRGLARGYGYSITVAAAQKYCPPNWEHWYNVVSAQMNKI